MIGPAGLRLITDVDNTLHFAETGIVFLVFNAGLKLEASRLRMVRRSVFRLPIMCGCAIGSPRTG
ncbi:MAG: cation:proton antiporter [Halofilum sp. (in: g-proteobacteria)]|nr:cation:proton antiporter [Halofilum sp. (in: g-proteobacteria)]